MIREANSDRGAAMLLVMAAGSLMLLLALVVTQAVVHQIRPSDHSEASFAAAAAAEAGIDDYRAHLLAHPDYYLNPDPANAALAGWVDVPGGTSDAQFTYAVDASRAGAGGEIHVFSTGRSNGVTHTIEAILTKRSTLDYVYMSDIETPSPDLPGAYSTAAVSGVTPAITGVELARKLCSRHWYETGQVSPTGTGNQRNLKFCQWAGIYTTEKLTGKIHTNDVWRLQNSDLSGSIDAGAITSSCPSTAEGLPAGAVGCSATRRYLSTSDIGSNNGANATWSSSTSYQGDSYRPTGTDSTKRNPRYDSVLELPQSPAAMKKHASESGCVYTGPTRIRFAEESGAGYMYVTSPDTKVTSTACGGTSLAGTPTAQPTVRIALAQFTDLSIYVQNVRRTTEADDPENAYDIVNRWATGAEPTCKVKGTSVYPFVIPTDPADQALFNSGSTYKGFPSEQANPSSPWYGSSCSSGDLWTQGSYKGRLTISTENNIILTSSLVDSTADATTGKPDAASQSVLGLVSAKFTYIYRPFKSDNSTWVGDWKTANAQNPRFNFALLAVDECFASQDPYYGTRQGDINLWGSLAQKYRCVVGSTGGYNKKYSFDDRLKRITPPYMLELSDEPWEVARYIEVDTHSQAVGTSTWPLVASDETSASVSNVRVTSGAATVSVAGTRATVTATAPGPVVVTYDVTLNASTIVTRRLVLLVG